MTKAEIVAEIAKQTGVEKTVVMNVVEAFMESVKESMIAGERSVPARIRQLYHQASGRENGAEYLEEHNDYDSRAQYSRFQAG